MNFKNIDWKVVAKIVGILLVMSIFINAAKYYEYRYSNLTTFIPEWV
jgi:hypothetical protein